MINRNGQPFYSTDSLYPYMQNKTLDEKKSEVRRHTILSHSDSKSLENENSNSSSDMHFSSADDKSE